MQKQSPELRASNFVNTLLRDGHDMPAVIDIIASAAAMAACLIKDETGYQLVLLYHGPRKIDLIKALRLHHSDGSGLKLDLHRAKTITETPNVILAHGSWAEVDKLAKELSTTQCKLFLEKQKTIQHYTGKLKWVC